MAKISDNEYKKFSEQLAQRFERKIKGGQITTTLLDLPYLMVRVVPFPTAEDVKNIDSASIKNNELYFYTHSYRKSVYNLLRHFRNCASHRDYITKEKRGGKWFYLFEDKGMINGNPYISMRGNVSCDIWDSFIEELYTTVLKEKQKKNYKSKKRPL